MLKYTVKEPKMKNNINVNNTDNNAILILLGEKNLVKLPTIKPFNILNIVKYKTLVLKVIFFVTIEKIKYIFTPNINKAVNKFIVKYTFFNLYSK